MQKIRIDFDNPGLPQHISAVENDSQSRFFQATLYENGKAYTAPEGATYSIIYRGFGPQNQGWYDTINDGAGKRAACAVSGNVVTCEIARQALQVPGHVSIVLCVTTGKGYMLKSWPIECDCKNDRYDSTAEIQSFFYVTQISNESWTQAIQAVEELKNTIDPTLSLSGKAADAAKVGEAVNAEATRAKAAEEENAKGIGQLKEDLVDLSHVRLLNGFDKDNTEINKYYNSQGVLSASNGWTASLSYARVEPSKSYHAKSIYNYDLQVIAVWYDGEHNFIKQELNTSFISPDNAKYARICCNTNYADVLVFGSFDSISEYLEFGNETVLNDSVATDRIDEAILSSQNEADYASNITDFYSSEFMNIILRNGFDKTSVLKNKYFYIDGSIKDSSGWGVNENYILIKPSVTYKAMSHSLDVKQNVKVAWYDKYKGFIRVDENVDFIAPNNAKFARLCCALSISDKFVFTEKENSSGEYLEYGYEKSIDKSVKIPIKPIKSEVTSVNGKKGDVVLTSEDIEISSDVEKAVTDYLKNNNIIAPKLTISKVVAREGIKNSYSTPTSDYVTFKDIYPVFDVGSNTTGAVYALAEHLVDATTQAVYKSIDGGEHWTKMGDLQIDQANGIWYNSIFVEPFQETIYTIKVTNGYNAPHHNYIESFNSSLTKIGSMDIGVGRMLSGLHSMDACISKDYSKRVVIFGEYALEDAKTVRMWKTVDRGATWTKVMEKRANNGVVDSGEIRHFHAVCCDPYTFDWWACSGDGNNQSKIWRSQDDGDTWMEMFANGQQTRTLQFVFEKDCIYYAMDSTTASTRKFTKLFKINREDMSVVEVADIKNNFAVYNITRTYTPNGLIIWACNENVASVDADSVCIQFYDYATETIKDIYNYPFNGIKNTYRGFQAASRRQDMESGNIFFMPTLNIGQSAYGTMNTCSRYFKAKITT